MDASVNNLTTLEWVVSESPVRIRYWLETLEALRGTLTTPASAGVLYGIHTGGTIAVVDFRPLSLSGPTFEINDGKELRRLLALPLRDQELAGTVPLGWYRSARSDPLELTATDIDVCVRYFPLAFQIILLVNDVDQAGIASFFIRRPDGSVLPDTPGTGEFLLPPPHHAPPARQPITPEAIVERLPVLPRRWPLVTTLSTAAFLLLVVLLPIRTPAPAAHVSHKLGLTVTNDGPVLRITWNPDRTIRSTARGGLLRIREGDEDTDALMLSQATPPGGGVTYRPRSAFVQVHLKIFRAGGTPAEESVLCLAVNH